MKNAEMLLKAFNSSDPDEIFEALSIIGKEDIEKLIGLSIMAKVVLRRLMGE